MGCGCNGKRSNGTTTAMTKNEQPTGSYSEPYKCRKCYAKHLSKAVAEWAEVLEDSSRFEEFSRCMGDIACAEDHASALGLDMEKSKLRNIRSRLWDRDKTVLKELQELASLATRSALFFNAKENAEAEKTKEKEDVRVKSFMRELEESKNAGFSGDERGYDEHRKAEKTERKSPVLDLSSAAKRIEAAKDVLKRIEVKTNPTFAATPFS